MPDIIQQLNRARRAAARQADRETPDELKHDWVMDVVVHIPVAAAIGISVYGYAQYGAFVWGLAPAAVALSLTLSRSVHRVIMAARTRADVASMAVLIAAFAFVGEAFGVHLGLERFNSVNAAAGLPTFGFWALMTASVGVCVMNLFSRRAFVTGLKNVRPDELEAAAERDRTNTYKAKQERNHRGWGETIRNIEGRARFGHDPKVVPGANGVQKITPEQLAEAMAKNDAKGPRPMTASAHGN